MWQLAILTTDTHSPQIEAQLEALDALSVSMVNAGDDILIEQFINEHPSWEKIKVEALFETQEQALFAQLALADLNPQLEPLADKNWLMYSLKDFQPIEIAKDFWIYPHWMLPNPRPKHCIALDPGFAFGTGQHETTRMCLEWLATHAIEDKTIIDYGCGSGILALAAIQLGAPKVYGIDIDPQALIASLQNAKLNDIDEKQFEIYDDPIYLPKTVDIIVANIVMNPLLELKTYFFKTLQKDGFLILSGLLKNQLPEVIAHYQTLFLLIDEKVDGDWGALVFKPKQV